MKFIISLLMVVMANSQTGYGGGSNGGGYNGGGGYSSTVQQKNWEIQSSIGCPCGLIDMWYGPLEAIPPGFQLCDGTNSTPDLRNRFVIGAGLDFNLGATGGSSSITVAIENMPQHKHQIINIATTSDSHYHTHNLKATTAGAHYHGVDLYTTDAGAHQHDVKNNDATVSIHPESGHYHGIPELHTGVDGGHDHEMQAFIDNDYATNKVAGIKAEWILDGDQPLSKGHMYQDKTVVDRVLPDGHHSHTIPADSTQGGSQHSHYIEGQVDTKGGHKHGVTGSTNNMGDHYHAITGDIMGGVHNHHVSGYTENYGHGTPIPYLPPYYAVYYICCVRPPLYPDKMVTSGTNNDDTNANDNSGSTNNNNGGSTNNNYDPDTYVGNDNSGTDNGGSDNSGRYGSGYNRQYGYGGYGYSTRQR